MTPGSEGVGLGASETIFDCVRTDVFSITLIPGSSYTWSL